MKKLLLPWTAALALAACHQEEFDTLPGTDCGSENHRIEVDVDGDGQCLSANITAVASSDGTVVMNGLALNGNGVTLQIDSMGYGDFPIDEGNNPVLWMEPGTPFTSTNDDPGLLTVLSYDNATRHISGTFTVVAHDAESPVTRELEGSFDIIYTVE